MKEGQGCFCAKSDMSMAFRNIPMNRKTWCYLILKAAHPVTGKTYYFVVKCLPFGASISCAIFQAFSDSVAYLVKFRTHKDLVNYLDDFFFAAICKAICNVQVEVFLDICDSICFPVSLEKTFWATQLLTFLGLLIDTVNRRISIPVDKLEKGIQMLDYVLNKKNKKLTLLFLQQLTGFLNFLCRCVVPGRTFLRRLYSLGANDKVLPHHHIRITEECRLDMQIWRRFLSDPLIYSRPFLDCFEQTAEDIDMYSDASESVSKGFGAYCGTAWTCMMWDKDWMVSCNPSIEYLELYAVTVAVLIWIKKFRNSRILLHCDNNSVCNMLNNSTSGCKNCMVLLRLVVLECLTQNVKLTAEWVSTGDNGKADALSRMEFERFRNLGPDMDMYPVPLQHVFGLFLRFGSGTNHTIYFSEFGRRAKSASKKSSSNSSRISTRHMQLIIDKLVGQSQRSSTMQNYLSIWRQFNRFVINLDVKPASWEDRVTLFIGYKIQNGMQSSTVKCYVSAIKKILMDDGYEWNDRKVLLGPLTKTCKIINDKVHTRLPIQCSLLELILFELHRKFGSHGQYYLQELYKTLFALSYYGMMRVSEVTQSNHVLRAKDVHFADKKEKIKLILYSSKTHSRGLRPQKIIITSNTIEKTGSYLQRNFCPFKLMFNYLNLRGEYLNTEEQFFIFRD